MSEQCDDGDNDSGDGCGEQCIVEDLWMCSGTHPIIKKCIYIGPICGNRIQQTGEACDDPNPRICNSKCQFPTCGDGDVNPANEDCDDPDPSICNSKC